MDEERDELLERIDPEHRLGTDTPIPRKPSDYLRYAFFGALGVLALAGVIYISGLHHIFFYRSTPTDITQQPVGPVVSEAQLTVPLTLHLFHNDGFFGTERTPESVRKTVENADSIWRRAAIALDIKGLYEYEMSDDDLSLLQYRPGEFVQTIEHYDPETINVLFVSNLQGINGISYGGLRTVAIADKTNVLDFRALAHEIGHQLGLDHVPESARLMSEGSDYVELSDEEVTIARREAFQFNQDEN